MLKTLRISFSLKNTYRVNSILYAIRQIPLVKKLIPSAVYGIRGFKILADVLSVTWEVISLFIWKMIYCLLAVYGAIALFEISSQNQAPVLMHILLILSIIGAIINTYMFDPSKDKYYAMILLGMNAKEYTVVNYFYEIIKILIGFAVGVFISGMLVGLSLWECIMVPFFVAGVKLFSSAIVLVDYEKRGMTHNENKQKPVVWVIIIVLLFAAYGLPFMGIVIPEKITDIFMGLGIILGLLSIHKILTFDQYRQMYKELLVDVIFDNSAVAVNAQKEQSRKRISTDTNITSTRKGFEYLNELFIKRHQSILWKSSKIITIVSFGFFVVSIIALQIKPGIKTEVNELLLTYLPYMVFVMYFLNRGTSFTQALFINCDHSLLTYTFYRQPKSILKLFCIRLREIIKINILPAVVIGLGLVALLFATRGTDNYLNYVILFVSTVAMSIFFSVHYLMLYYLLQPYNAGTEIKSGTYQIITWGTYFVCYMMLQVKMPTILFGMMTIIFSVVYCIIASILVYKFAPKTFKIRN